jgi:hypothetical protein
MIDEEGNFSEEKIQISEPQIVGISFIKQTHAGLVYSIQLSSKIDCFSAISANFLNSQQVTEKHFLEFLSIKESSLSVILKNPIQEQLLQKKDFFLMINLDSFQISTNITLDDFLTAFEINDTRNDMIQVKN